MSKMRRSREQLYFDIIKICNGKNYELITKYSEFKGSRSAIKYLCPIHGEHKVRADCLLSGQSCPKCSATERLRKRYDDNFNERMSKLYTKAKLICEEKGYHLLSTVEDINCNTSYIKYECPIHGIHEMRLGNLYKGCGCPDCNIDDFVSKMRLSLAEVKLRLDEMRAVCLNAEEYINLETENLIFVCEYCGDEYTTSLIKFIRYAKHNCPICSRKVASSGELKIYNYLCENNIYYEKDKCFDDCKDERMLPFDFYIPQYNICIEYQGQQHYHPVEVFKGETGFKLRQKHDAMKREFCKVNNIKLIEIPYWEYDNIEKILKDKLISHEDIV